MASVGNGFVDCVNLLLAEGANIQALDVYHRSALHRAVSYHSQAVVTCYFRKYFVLKERVHYLQKSLSMILSRTNFAHSLKRS